MSSEPKVGDKIMTAPGELGTIAEIRGNSFFIRMKDARPNNSYSVYLRNQFPGEIAVLAPEIAKAVRRAKIDAKRGLAGLPLGALGFNPIVRTHMPMDYPTPVVENETEYPLAGDQMRNRRPPGLKYWPPDFPSQSFRQKWPREVSLPETVRLLRRGSGVSNDYIPGTFSKLIPGYSGEIHESLPQDKKSLWTNSTDKTRSINERERTGERAFGNNLGNTPEKARARADAVHAEVAIATPSTANSYTRPAAANSYTRPSVANSYTRPSVAKLTGAPVTPWYRKMFGLSGGTTKRNRKRKQKTRKQCKNRK